MKRNDIDPSLRNGRPQNHEHEGDPQAQPQWRRNSGLHLYEDVLDSFGGDAAAE